MHTQGMGTERCRCLHQRGGFHLFIPTSGFKTRHTTGELLGGAGRQAGCLCPAGGCLWRPKEVPGDSGECGDHCPGPGEMASSQIIIHASSS